MVLPLIAAVLAGEILLGGAIIGGLIATSEHRDSSRGNNGPDVGEAIRRALEAASRESAAREAKMHEEYANKMTEVQQEGTIHTVGVFIVIILVVAMVVVSLLDYIRRRNKPENSPRPAFLNGSFRILSIKN